MDSSTGNLLEKATPCWSDSKDYCHLQRLQNPHGAGPARFAGITNCALCVRWKIFNASRSAICTLVATSRLATRHDRRGAQCRFAVGVVARLAQWAGGGAVCEGLGRETINAGGCPAASHFSCLAKKSNQKKSPPVCRPSRDSLRCSSGQAAAELALRAQT
jgi:hypothetical protein